MEWKQSKRELKLLWKSVSAYWGKSLEELMVGTSAKYKGLTGISWLNVHRLFDFRVWRFVRFRLFQWRKDVNIFIHKNLFFSKLM